MYNTCGVSCGTGIQYIHVLRGIQHELQDALSGSQPLLCQTRLCRRKIRARCKKIRQQMGLMLLTAIKKVREARENAHIEALTCRGCDARHQREWQKQQEIDVCS